MAKKCVEKRIIFTCPHCKETFMLPRHIAEKKQFCSAKCEKESGSRCELAKNASKCAAEASHKRNIAYKSLIASDILSWALDHCEFVLNCRYNNVNPYYKPLLDYLYGKYGYRDIRSYYICFNVKDGRSFAKYLKEYVSEKIYAVPV